MVTSGNPAGTDAAYATCLRLAREHYENFPVASWLMPPAARPHVAAIYAFARIADDFADEGRREPADRLALLDMWQQRLDAAARGEVTPTNNLQDDAVFVALAATLRQHPPYAGRGFSRADSGVMRSLLSDLLSAFRQDVTTTRYENWDSVLDYCRRSANPVGRLMLLVTGNHDPVRASQSDALCTALQLTNFWQDLARDWASGRLYVPLDLVRAHGARIEDLDSGRWTPEWSSALRDAGDRTHALFAAGRPVADGVRGRLRLELRSTWLGGHRILDRLAEADYDVFHARPSLAWPDAARIAAGALLWRRSA
ncbi:MAG: squalene synthase HpnC [Acidobacteria bacterium]|nr:squalene synthase HpnC [Acidobacteriota bacterium]